MKRSPTFLVGSDKQRGILDEFQKREQHFEEDYQKNKPLCFNGRSYQKTHPAKTREGIKDADACLASPVLLGVCDGVSQLEDYGIDASILPQELLAACEELAMGQLMPDGPVSPSDRYRGPVSLLKEAYENTESLGSTTVLLGVLDNSTQIHGKLHPMIAVLSIGDCELLLLRRTIGRQSPLEAVFHTEMQRIDGHCQTPLQVPRVDDRIDENFDEAIALEVIERGSAVHCMSAYEGDIVIMGSDGVFDNLFLDEIVDLANEMLFAPLKVGNSGNYVNTDPKLFSQLAQRIVHECHVKATDGLAETPIGWGGKVDDTSCVVAEVVEWTDAHRDFCQAAQSSRNSWTGFMSCGIGAAPSNSCKPCRRNGMEYEDDEQDAKYVTTRGLSHDGSGYASQVEGEESDDDDDKNCVIL